MRSEIVEEKGIVMEDGGIFFHYCPPSASFGAEEVGTKGIEGTMLLFPPMAKAVSAGDEEIKRTRRICQPAPNV